jgi:DNA-binding MarR family transcriptional regulator
MDETNESIGFLFQNVSSLLARYSDKALQKNIGIGYSQYKIMSSLVLQNNIRQIDIAHLLGQTEASVSRQIKIIRDRGLVNVRFNPNNHREHLIQLTKKGHDKYDRATLLLNRMYLPIFRQLNDKQIIEFQKSLSLIQYHLNSE